MTIAAFFETATRRLTNIPTARLDALVLMSEVLQKDKSWILAHTDHELSPDQAIKLSAQLKQRVARVPLAYILGHQEFYGRDFIVTPDVLIPRPETEALIELAKKYIQTGKLLDIGTGSGAIAVTLACELPAATVEACDVSQAALAVARSNAQRLRAHVHFFESDLLAGATGPYNAIVANLPYVARDWERSPETNAEPSLALFADDNGLALIKQLINEAKNNLIEHGYLLLEADPRQHAEITDHAKAFRHIATQNFAVVLQRQQA
jgi:release factor glutamine methyltransferase